MLELDAATIRSSRYDSFKGHKPATATVTEVRQPDRQQRHSYKPIALKLPSLVVFFSIFAVCIGMIELLLAAANDSRNSTTTAIPSNTIGKRGACLSNSDYSAELAGIESQYSNLCSQFSKTYAPVSANLTPALQTSFNQWNAQLNNLLSTKSAITAGAQTCQSSTTTILPVTVFGTAGCATSIELLSQSECIPSFGGSLTLVGSVISTTWTHGVCAITSASQLVIASQSSSSKQTLAPNTSVSPSASSSSASSSSTSPSSPSQSLITTQSTISTSSLPSASVSAAATTPSSAQVTITSQSRAKTTTSQDLPKTMTTSNTETLPTITIAATGLTSVAVPISSNPLPNAPSPPSSVNNPITPIVVTIYGTGTRSSKVTYFAFTTVTEYTSLIPTTNSHGSTTSVLAIVQQTVVMTSTSKPSSGSTTVKLVTSTEIATASPTTTTLAGVLAVPSQEKDVNATFTNWTYFAALYLAPILAVVIKALYEVVVASLKMVEPFQRMSHPTGSTAAYSVFAEYLSSSISLDAFRALMYGHLLPLWSTLMYIFVGIGAPLASAAMNVRSRSTCLVDGIERYCDPVWVVNLVIVRCLEAILALCMLLVLALIFSTWKYSIPVASNPSSIVSLATLLNHEPLLHDLQHIDPDANDEEFQDALQRHLFWLEDHENLLTHHHHYGIVGFKYSEHRRRVPHLLDRFKHSRESLVVDYVPVTDLPQPPVRSPSPSIHTQTTTTSPRQKLSRKTISLTSDILQVFTTFVLLALLLTYSFDYKTDSFNDFFNSQKVLPKIIFVGLATVVDAQMKRLERIVRITEPYRRLSLGDAIPETTILLPLNGTCWSNLPRCIFYSIRYPTHHMGWQTTVSLVAALGDLNIIAVAGVLFSEAQTTRAFQICAYVAIVFTIAMLLVSLVALLWWRRIPAVKGMPRRPDTIAGVLGYLCGSLMVRDWMVGMEMEKMTAKERDKFIINSSRTFCFRRMPGTDERMRWCVDFERDDEK